MDYINYYYLLSNNNVIIYYMPHMFSLLTLPLGVVDG
jgi:hypothetical protein